MKISSASRYFSEAMKSIFRNKMMSLSSIIIATACLLIMILMYVVTANITAMLTKIESEVRISAFIDNDVDAQGVMALYNEISNHEKVLSVNHLNAEENLRDWIERSNFNPDMFEMLIRINAVRRRFDINLENIDDVRVIAAWLESPEMAQRGIDNVNHASDEVDGLRAINRAIRNVCLGSIAVLGLLSIVIIANTVRLTIDSRKNEISIMKFIGSTNWFIRWPFVLEGLILGFVGASIAVALVIVFYDQLRSLISGTFLINIGLDLLTGANIFPVMIPAALFIGAAIGTLSSIGTIRKYLDV